MTAVVSPQMLAVVAFPALGPADSDWIEAVRTRHDPQAGRIAAHLTLVFPEELPEAALVEAVPRVAAEGRPVPFTIEEARAVPARAGDESHVFLLPGEGAAAITDLHTRLWVAVHGPLARDDRPYEPHITVAAGVGDEACRDLAAELHGRARSISGRLDSLDLVRLADGVVLSSTRFKLAGKQGGRPQGRRS